MFSYIHHKYSDQGHVSSCLYNPFWVANVLVQDEHLYICLCTIDFLNFTEDLVFTNNDCPVVHLETFDTFECTDFQVYLATCLSVTCLNLTEHFVIDCDFT